MSGFRVSPRTPRPQGLITKMCFATMLHTSCTMGTSPLPRVFLTPGSSPKEPLLGAGHFRWQKENRVDESCDVSERFPSGVFATSLLSPLGKASHVAKVRLREAAEEHCSDSEATASHRARSQRLFLER